MFIAQTEEHFIELATTGVERIEKCFYSSRLAPFDIDDVKIDRVMKVDHESRREGSKNATSKFAECQHTNRRSLKGC